MGGSEIWGGRNLALWTPAARQKSRYPGRGRRAIGRIAVSVTRQAVPIRL